MLVLNTHSNILSRRCKTRSLTAWLILTVRKYRYFIKFLFLESSLLRLMYFERSCSIWRRRKLLLWRHHQFIELWLWWRRWCHRYWRHRRVLVLNRHLSEVAGSVGRNHVLLVLKVRVHATCRAYYVISTGISNFTFRLRLFRWNRSKCHDIGSHLNWVQSRKWLKSLIKFLRLLIFHIWQHHFWWNHVQSWFRGINAETVFSCWLQKGLWISNIFSVRTCRNLIFFWLLNETVITKVCGSICFWHIVLKFTLYAIRISVCSIYFFVSNHIFLKRWMVLCPRQQHTKSFTEF